LSFICQGEKTMANKQQHTLSDLNNSLSAAGSQIT